LDRSKVTRGEKSVYSTMKVYIIGKRGGYRNADLIAQLPKNFQVVVDDGYVPAKSRVSKEDYSQIFTTVIPRTPTAGEIACSTAHLQAWRYLVGSEFDCLLVLEDDVRSARATLDSIQSMTEGLRGPWFLSLERRPGDHLLSHVFLRWPRVTRSFVQPRGAGAYIISKQAALIGIRDFESSGNKLEGPVDRWPGPAGLFRFYVALPPLFKVEPDAISLIGSRNIIRAEGYFVPKIRMVRVLLSRNITWRKRLGILSLTVGRPLKYCFSTHFFTEWLKVRRR
jgi:hypothetical protein